MRQRHCSLNRLLVSTALGLAAPFAASAAFAQETPPATLTPASAVKPADAPAKAVPATPPVTPKVAQVDATVTAPAASVQTAAAPPVVDESEKPLSVSMWGRIGTTATNSKPEDAGKLNDLGQSAEVDALFSGKIHPNVGWQADFVATYGTGSEIAGNKDSGQAAVLDLIGKLEPVDAFNVWFGRMLVPSDRSNFAGPWFMAPWNYPGLTNPRQGKFGRNDGVTAWGQFAGGLFKYYAGAFNLHESAESPLYSGRINVSLINPEPGFYHSATYYGQDRLAFGASVQYQKNGSTPAATTSMMGGMTITTPAPKQFDYMFASADALYEKVLGAGVLDIEGAVFKPFIKDCEMVNGVNACPADGGPGAVKMGFWGLASFLLPEKLGIGKIQPLFRFQGQTVKEGDMNQVIDAQVGYVIKDYAARLALGYERSKYGAADATNAIFLGLQLQK